MDPEIEWEGPRLQWPSLVFIDKDCIPAGVSELGPCLGMLDEGPDVTPTYFIVYWDSKIGWHNSQERKLQIDYYAILPGDIYKPIQRSN